MQKIDFDSYLDDEFDLNDRGRGRVKRNKTLVQKEKRIQSLTSLAVHGEKAPIEAEQSFVPTYKPARHERVWLFNYLESFYNNQVITDILWKAKGGKEANVYCCAAHPSTGENLIAAKVYRPRMLRNLRNDARYRQGRDITDEEGKSVHSRREALAMRKNTRFGQELRHDAWLGTEYLTMQLLSDAGADVPRPLAHGDNVILMEYIGAERFPAPTLVEVSLKSSEAGVLFARLVDNLSIMLACHRVHADFSAYNILYWEGQIKIIDFPQAVDPRRNPDARQIFDRDVERLCQYFARYGIHRGAHALADDLWDRFQRENALDAGRDACEM